MQLKLYLSYSLLQVILQVVVVVVQGKYEECMKFDKNMWP